MKFKQILILILICDIYSIYCSRHVRDIDPTQINQKIWFKRDSIINKFPKIEVGELCLYDTSCSSNFCYMCICTIGGRKRTGSYCIFNNDCESDDCYFFICE